MGEEANGRTDNGRRNSRRKWALAVFSAASLATVVAGAFYWWYRQSHIATDDAFVEGRIHPVAARIQGTVVEVLVEDNQPVKAGQPVARIDPSREKAITTGGLSIDAIAVSILPEATFHS